MLRNYEYSYFLEKLGQSDFKYFAFIHNLNQVNGEPRNKERKGKGKERGRREREEGGEGKREKKEGGRDGGREKYLSKSKYVYIYLEIEYCII